MKTLKALLIPLAIFSSIMTNSAMAFSKKDVTTCTSPGADPTGVVDSAPAIQNCINSAGSEAAIYFPPGYYKIGSTLTVNKHRVTLYSEPRTAVLKFTGCDDLIKFIEPTGKPIENGGIRGLWLQGSNGGSCTQKGLHIVDGSWVFAEDVAIDYFTSTTDQSIGIQTNGREGFNVRNAHISANQPIVIAKNPNWPTLDADHFHFENMYTTVLGGGQHWHFTLKDQVMVSNTVVDGQNPMVKGCGILQWISTTANGASFHLKLANIRLEQITSGCDKPIDIELPTSGTLQSLVLDNISIHDSPPAINGIYLKSVDGLTVRDSTYWNVATAGAQANFINATGIKFIELQNNHVYYFGQKIIANDSTGTALVWKAGPYTGKECCYPATIRTTDSGILGQP